MPLFAKKPALLLEESSTFLSFQHTTHQVQASCQHQTHQNKYKLLRISLIYEYELCLQAD